MAPKMFPTSQVAKRAGQQQSRALRSGRGPPTTSLFGFLTQVAVLAVWKTLWTVSVPVGRFIALQLWLGKSFITLSIWLQHQLLKAIGWLAAPIPTSSRVSKVYKRTLGFDVRNWHVGLGEWAREGRLMCAN